MSLLSEKQYYELGKFFIDLGKGIAIGMFGFAAFAELSSSYFVFTSIVSGSVVVGCVTIGLILINSEKYV